MVEIKKIETDGRSLTKLSHFLSECFPKTNKFTEEFVRWQYVQNPLGAMEGFNAWHEGKIVSHFAGLPIEMMIRGKKRRGLLCINVCTHADHRGGKLFTKLGQETIKYATEHGYDFMIAVPNGNSTHAFLRYFGFYLVSPLAAKVGMGGNIFPKDRKFNCYKLWDDDQWLWRLQNPANRYQYNPEGIISTPISFFAKTISSARLVGRCAERASAGLGLRPLNLYVGLGADTSKGIYMNIPSFVKRPPFNLVFKDLTGSISPIGADDIFIQLIDLDTI